MDKTLFKALNIILLSLGLAFVFNFLFFEKVVGVSIFIFFTVLLTAVLLFGRRELLTLKNTWWIVLLILFFAAAPGVRANEFLSFLNLCAVLGLLLILAYQLAGMPAWLMRLRDYAVLAVLVPFKMLGRALAAIFMLGQIHSSVKNRDVWLRVFKGAVLAVPLLIIFGLLFSQADFAFSKFISGFIHIHISQNAVHYLFMLVFSFVCALGFLSYIFLPKAAQPAAEKPALAPKPDRGVEFLVFLGLIASLFLLFIIFQITYLFGGQTNIVNAGFTYAEYARHGFWELLVVAFLSLVVLLASEKFAGMEERKDQKFLIPALVLIAEVFVIIISAFKRLSLYIDAYGMTSLRFYVAAFIVLLLALFILLAIKFIKLKQEQFFAFGTLLSVIAFLGFINFINPDAFIIRSNINQLAQTGKVDVSYISELSADAESGKIELYNKLQGQDKETLRLILQKDKASLQKNSAHWQSANFSRSKALKLLQNIEK